MLKFDMNVLIMKEILKVLNVFSVVEYVEFNYIYKLVVVLELYY